jgi:hypothetical protein
MTSISTKAQAQSCGKQMLARSVRRSSTLRTLTTISSERAKFWSEVDSMFTEVDCSWY